MSDSSNDYRIFGAEISPYSVKVRSYFRYKGIPHEWIPRNPSVEEEFRKYARLPLVPVVATPDDEGLQDSTPIIEAMEARFPEPSIHPAEPRLAFVSALVEEFGDEWGNKWMFHFRWAREVDQNSAGERLAKMMMPDAEGEQLAAMVEGVKGRMVGRVWFVGSNKLTGPQIEASFRAAVADLDAHLAERPYLFGGRPAFGDFGLWGQVYCAWTDPTCKEILELGPNVVGWLTRMLEPKAEGDFETWEALAPTLQRFLEEQVAKHFLPWSDANARAIASGAEEFSVELASGRWTQKPQKYHARSLKALRARYAEVQDDEALAALLDATGCRRWLQE